MYRQLPDRSYESAWIQWCSWCDKQQLNLLQASIQHVVNFLAYHFEAGKEYRTINVYRLALSTTLPKQEGVSVGQHPLVCQTMKGIFQKKPPLPRYCSSWDISIVLEYIKSLGDNENLTIKQLSAKLALLFALISAERGSELVAHGLRFKKSHPEGVEFHLPELTKSIRVGKNLKVSFHASFPFDKRLCPCECLKVYETCTANLRPLNVTQPNKLFLALVKPHKPVQAATLAHWIYPQQELIPTFSKPTLHEGLHHLLQFDQVFQ